MKKVTILGLILLGLGFSPLLVKADIIPSNSHFLDICAKVVNIDNFPEISIFGVITGPMVESDSTVVLKNNECISAGYKFNSINIYWNTKSKATQVYDTNLLIKKMDTWGEYVNDSNPLVKEEIEYSVVKSTDGKISLEKTKIISKYNNGAPDKIETFSISSNNKKIEVQKDIPAPIVVNKNGNSDIPNNNELPVQPVKKSFWHRLACFFGIIRTC